MLSTVIPCTTTLLSSCTSLIQDQLHRRVLFLCDRLSKPLVPTTNSFPSFPDNLLSSTTHNTRIVTDPCNGPPNTYNRHREWCCDVPPTKESNVNSFYSELLGFIEQNLVTWLETFCLMDLFYIFLFHLLFDSISFFILFQFGDLNTLMVPVCDNRSSFHIVYLISKASTCLNINLGSKW